MLTTRIIPCLDIRDGRVVKGINFVDIIDAGDPVETAKKYSQSGADEIVFLDITASHEKRRVIFDTVERTAAEVFIPLTVGGGISDLETVRQLLLSGADKVSLNSPAVNDPSLITKLAERFGSQCITVAIDAKREDGWWQVYINGGRTPTGIDAVKWAAEAAQRGCGEILLTSMGRDGTKEGFEIPLTKAISDAVNVPVIASGGAGKMEHFVSAVTEGGASAVLAASLFHYGELAINDLKAYMLEQGLSVRL